MVLLVHNTHLIVRGIGILHLLRSLSISLVILTDIFSANHYHPDRTRIAVFIQLFDAYEQVDDLTKIRDMYCGFAGCGVGKLPRIGFPFERCADADRSGSIGLASRRPLAASPSSAAKSCSSTISPYRLPSRCSYVFAVIDTASKREPTTTGRR
jgi:hypothetical protein